MDQGVTQTTLAVLGEHLEVEPTDIYLGHILRSDPLGASSTDMMFAYMGISDGLGSELSPDEVDLAGSVGDLPLVASYPWFFRSLGSST